MYRFIRSTRTCLDHSRSLYQSVSSSSSAFHTDRSLKWISGSLLTSQLLVAMTATITSFSSSSSSSFTSCTSARFASTSSTSATTNTNTTASSTISTTPSSTTANISTEGVPLSFIAESSYEPHPEKKAKGTNGEDAYYASKYSLGVADGVGGWSEMGIDTALYSRDILKFSREYIDNAISEGQEPNGLEAIVYAFQKNKQRGTCTISLVIAGKNNTIRIHNVGDSGLQIWRHHRPKLSIPLDKLPLNEASKLWDHVYTAPTQQHQFNTPYQIGEGCGVNDAVHGAHLSVSVLPGDLIIMGTDGLWDNLYPEDIQKILARFDFTQSQLMNRMKKAQYEEALRIERELDNQKRKDAGEQPKTYLEDRVIRGIAPQTYTDQQVQEQTKICRTQLASIASMLVMAAHRVGNDPKALSPFAKEYKKRFGNTGNNAFDGGKLDDTAVIVGLIVPDNDYFSVFG